MNLRSEIRAILGEAFDVDNETIAERIAAAIEERLESFRAGIDQAAEQGSDAATRDSNLLNELEAALFGE
jgi:hypothetical protein